MQSNFTNQSMYSTGGQPQGFGGQQQSFGSPGFGGNIIPGQGFGGQAAVVQQSFGGQQGGQGGFYPTWFPQYTGRQPMQIEQLIQAQFGQYVTNLFNLQMVQQLMAGLQNTNELPNLLNKVRTYAFVLMLDKASPAASQQTEVIIQRTIEVVLFGEIVRRVGGPHMPFVKTLSDTVRMDVAELFSTYNMFETAPNIYSMAVQKVESQIRAAMQAQQQQNPFGGQAQGFGGGFGGQVHPAASAAVPSGNFSAYLNQNPQQQVNTFGGVIASAGNVTPANETISQIGRVAGGSTVSIYAIALQNDQTRHVQEQQVVEQRVAENREATRLHIPADNVSGVTDAFSLAAKIQREGLQLTKPTEPAVPNITTPVEEVAPYVDSAEESQVRPRAVIPATWSNKQAERLADPIAEFTQPPSEGLPSLGFYNMAAGAKTTMSDFNIPANTEQHTEFAPVPTRTFDDEAGRLEEDDFLNSVDQQMEAEIQAAHAAERNENPLHPTSNMDDLVKQGQEQNLSANFEDQELRIDFTDMDSKSRKNICKQFHIRVVPAYVMGHNRVIQIMKGKRRTIVVERVENVKYEEHETENVNSTPVFATWDVAARDMGLAKGVMADAASKPVWSSDDLLAKLDQKLQDSDNPDDMENKLSELIAERSIIQIDGALTSSSPQGDYQGEVVVELTNRGVKQAGTVIDNAIVEYERFETAYLAIQDENESLIEGILEAKTVIELIGALNNFRKNSTLPVREISRLHHTFTKYLNQYLKVEFSNGWSTSDPIEDQDELTRALLQSYAGELSAHEIMNKLTDIYTTSAQKAYRLVGAESEESSKAVGSLHTVVLLPIYYSQYPLATLDDVGAIQNADHPELYELLSKVYSEGKDVKIVTLDNYALTFVRALGDSDLFYLVEVTN